MELYSHPRHCDPATPDQLESIIEFLTEIAKERSCRRPSLRLPKIGDLAGCSACQGIFLEPVTVSCGHTFCRKCLIKENVLVTCNVCGTTNTFNHISNLKINVTISTLVEKWWSNALQSAKLRCDGNELFLIGKVDLALEKYTRAYELDPDDHLVASNRSHALLILGQTQEALNVADLAIHLCPTWPKGYFRKGAALASLGRYEEAAVAYLQCLVLDSSVAIIKQEVTELIQKSVIPLNSSLKHGGSESSCSSSASFPGQNFLGGSDGSIYSIASSDSLYHTSDSDEESFYQTESYRTGDWDYSCFHKVLDRLFLEAQKVKSFAPTLKHRPVDPKKLDKKDVECPLCFRLFWQPVTTPCGHMFCRMCLDRCLDHQPFCPMCKTSLQEYLAKRQHTTTEFMELVLQTFFPEDFVERKLIFEEEMEELVNAGKDPEHVIPLFVCAMAFPTIPCPLHIFEPRYRLMIRQCIESGTRQFGMCTYSADSSQGVPDYGSMLEIRDIQYFPDGRSIVYTVGGHRFHVLRRGMRDGYNTGAVEFLKDEPPEGAEIQEVKRLHGQIYREAETWFMNLPQQTKQQILQHFGAMPAVENDYLTLVDGPAWIWWVVATLPIDPKAQLAILAMTSLRKRLDTVHRIFQFLHCKGAF